MITIHLGKGTTIGDVERWNLDSEASIRFILFPDSHFVPVAEGIALGRLYSLIRANSRIEVIIENAPKRPTANAKWFISRYKATQSLFTVALLNHATSVSTRSGQEIKNTLFQALWTEVIGEQGFLSSGHSRAIVFRDPDYVFPGCLPCKPPLHFPSPLVFGSALRRLFADIVGISYNGDHPAHRALLSFIRELLLNSHEHGAHDPTGKTLSGFRGLLIERIDTWGAGASATPPGIATVVPDYCKAMARVPMGSRRRFVCFTIVDNGPGIHRTLPGLPGESDLDRLRRAFCKGVSSKEDRGDIERGLGLTKALQACELLRALLVIRSGDLLCAHDFNASKALDYSAPHIEAIRGQLAGSVGTSITLVWPLEDAGQGMLFQIQ